ncbi:MAG: hypothetical protein ABI977_25285 [Acidobacteriota bacterium]
MNQEIAKKWGQVVALVALLACGSFSAAAQPVSNAERVTELRKIRDELRTQDSFRNADAVVVLGERAIAEAVRQFAGMEIALANGSVMKLTSFETQLVTGAAIIKIGVQSKSVNLQLSGLLTSGEIKDGRMRMPFRVTEVKLLNSLISSVFIKTMFGAWLKPDTWNDELPSLDLPLEINEAMEIPASRFDVEGQLPMEIGTAAYRVPMKLSLTSLLFLDRRAVLVLQANSPVPVNSSMVESVIAGSDMSALLNEIHHLGAGLTVDGDVRLRLGRNILSSLLSQIAWQQNPDLKFKLKQGRLRSNEVKTVISIINYTDITNGDGQADISEMRVESINDGNINLRLSGQGVIDAQIKGREYGIPYGFSPRTSFEIKDQPIPLQFTSENGRVMLRAVAGSVLPINLRFSVQVAGQEISVNRTEAMQVDRWLNRIEFPALLNREILLPRRLEVDGGGNLHVTQREKLGYALSNMRMGTSNDAIDIVAEIKVNPK